MEQDIKQETRSLKIVHIALIIGTAFFLVISFVLNQTTGGFIDNGNETNEFKSLLLIVANVMTVFSIPGGLIIFRQKMKNIDRLLLPQKLPLYRQATIIRAATMEGPAFMFIVGFMLTGSKIFMYEGLGILMFMIFHFPTNSRIARETNIDIRTME